MDLHNRVVIVTGASMGIGAATAREFARAGAQVALAARSAEPLAELAQQIGAERALAIPADVTNRAQVDALVQHTLARFGRIDILVNNAGVGLAGPVATISPIDFERIFAINVLGPLYAMQAVAPHLRKPGGGLIINVSSMVTKLTIPTIGGYRATKMALDAISDNARIELARDNIRVITIYPGQTSSNFFRNTINAADRSGRPPGTRRPDTPEHVARRIVEGARQEPREVFMNPGMRAAAVVGTLLPRLFEWAIGRRMRG
jgi:NAD(P)-dependent dehydrogenase (short-subunit alcohol dehydrogenase family)